MEIKNILSRKSAKLLMLLLINMLVVTVSAAMYYSLSMTSTIDVYAADVYFVEGSDNGTAGGAILTLDSTNTTATITGLRAYPNMTFTYENLTMVRNNATGTTPYIRLTPDVNPSANPEDFEYVKFMLNGTSAQWLNFTSDGSTWSNTGTTSWITIPTETQWPIAIMTKATVGATISDSVTITIKVDVD